MKPKYIKNFFPNLFSWEELEYLLNIRPLMNTQRVQIFNEKREEIKHDDGWDTPSWSIDDDCYPPSLLKEYIEKYLCVFNDMSRCSKNINKVASIIEKNFKNPVDAHIYVCRNVDAVHPFKIHTDRVDNVIIQCEGKTNFKIWDMEQNPLLDVILCPGDAIFVPALFPHEPITLTPRMSVSFPLHTFSNTFEERTWIKL